MFDAIEVTEVRVAPLLAADADEIQLAVLLVHAQQLRDVAVAGGDRVLLAPGLQVVQVELAPVVALGKPDHLVRARQVPPVHRAVARLEERLGLLFQHVADRRRSRHRPRAAARAGDRARSTRTPRVDAVGAPLHVAPLAAARHVVAQRRAMLIGRQLQADDLPAVHVDDDALDHGDRRRRRAADISTPAASGGRPWCPPGTSRRRRAGPAGTSRSSSSRATSAGSGGRCASSRRCRWRSRSPSRRPWSAAFPSRWRRRGPTGSSRG